MMIDVSATYASKSYNRQLIAPHELIPWYWWAPVLLISIIVSCVVLGVQYKMPVGMSLLSVFLAF